MRTLEGGCSVPIGVETRFLGGEEGKMQMLATVTAVDGSRNSMVDVVSEAVVGGVGEAAEFGREVARRLIEEGAGEILKGIELNRAIVDT